MSQSRMIHLTGNDLTDRPVRVYVAGKYSDDNVLSVLDNIRKGQQVCIELFSKGYAPFCPWHDAHFILGMTDQQYSSIVKQMFYDYSITWLKVCDVMLIYGGREVLDKSPGTEEEWLVALDRRIPVYFSIEELISDIGPTIFSQKKGEYV